MEIAVSRFDAADPAAITAAYEINVAATLADTPDLPPQSRHFMHAAVTAPFPGERVEWALGLVGGEPAGYVTVELPLLDNTNNAWTEVVVHPAYRRRGVGRALYAYATRVARENNRKRLAAATWSGLPGGPARDQAGDRFLEAMGSAPALTEIRRRLDVSSVDHGALDGALADGWRHADGYSVVRWRGAAPEDYVADLAYLDGRLLQDAPMGDLDWEPEKVDVARYRAREAAQEVRRRRNYHVGVRHDASDRMVAWTMLSLNDEPEWHSWQQITIVDPEHRGHRLGTIVKVENLRYATAAEPGLRYIDTCNAAVNDYMISINELLGFRAVDTMVDWQHRL